jgi:hypothetical protein
MAVMSHVPRPLLGLLVATVVFFALWLVALKPSSSGTSSGPGLGQYQPAINAAKASVAAQNRAAAAANATSGAATTSATPASGAVTAAKAATTTPTTPATAATSATGAKASGATKATARAKSASRTHTAKPAAATSPATPTQRVNLVDRALSKHKVLALLFYNPAAADDQAVRQELRTIPTRRGRVVKLAIPVSEVANYPVLTNQVPIESSPTLVIIDRAAQAFMLTGFATGFEIAHRVDDALTMH